MSAPPLSYDLRGSTRLQYTLPCVAADPGLSPYSLSQGARARGVRVLKASVKHPHRHRDQPNKDDSKPQHAGFH